jgi:hypothetical protein
VSSSRPPALLRARRRKQHTHTHAHLVLRHDDDHKEEGKRAEGEQRGRRGGGRGAVQNKPSAIGVNGVAPQIRTALRELARGILRKGLAASARRGETYSGPINRLIEVVVDGRHKVWTGIEEPCVAVAELDAEEEILLVALVRVVDLHARKMSCELAHMCVLHSCLGSQLCARG